MDPVGEIYGRLTRRQLAYWMAFLQLEPPAEHRAEMSSAFQNAVLFNRRLREGEQPVQLDDLLIPWETRSEVADPISNEIQREEAMVETILAHFG